MTHWDDAAIGAEATANLQGLLRFDTTNPPGNELGAIKYLAEILKRDGIESTILESAPGRANLVARLKGDGSQKPFLLMGHVDVVPVEHDKWIHPPFGAEIHDDFIYARGALDMKGVVAVELMVFLLLKRMGVPLKRDVIFMANADEETGGSQGAKWMVDNHPELIRAEYGLNEGGGSATTIDGTPFVSCQTGEKGNSRFLIRTRGTPGHASQPHRDNAILHLADALVLLGEARLPMHVTATGRAYVEGIAHHLGPEGEEWLGLLDPKTFWSTLENLPVDYGTQRMLIAMFHNTAVPTILKAGAKTNVIPSVAEAQIDSRQAARRDQRIVPAGAARGAARVGRNRISGRYARHRSEARFAAVQQDSGSDVAAHARLRGAALSRGGRHGCALPDEARHAGLRFLPKHRRADRR